MQARSGPGKSKRRHSNGGAVRPEGTTTVPVWGNALPSRSERAALKRNSIVREAARCFSRTGFHGTSMDDIAERLGVTKAALYRYVPNKHEVLFASFNLAMDSSFANLERGEREGKNGLEKLRIALRGYLEELIGKLGHPVVLLEDSALLPDQSRALIRRRDEAEKRFRKLVKEGIDDGSVVPCDPKLAVFALLGAINWVPKWYRDDGEWTAAQLSESLVNLITRSIAAHPDRVRAEERDGGKRQSVTTQASRQGERK
jgi:TetR/AcrR family transcriptional regulator